MVFVNISSNRILYPEVVDLVKEVFLAILIQAMRSTGESRMTDQYHGYQWSFAEEPANRYV